MIVLAVSALDLSRIQFAVTTLFHFIFVPLTLGLAPLLAIMQTLAYRTKDEKWERLGAVLRDAVPDQLRDRDGDRDRAGVRVRDELVVVLEVRRRRLRGAARDRGARSVHARVDLHRALGLRSRPPRAEGAPGDDLPRLGRHLALGVLHHRRQLVDAAPGRVRDQQDDRHGPGERHRDDHVPGVRDLRVCACDPRRLSDRWLRRPRRRGVASAAGSQRRRFSLGSEARDRAADPTHRVSALLGKLIRGADHQRATDEDRRHRGALGHGAAGVVLDLPDRGLHEERPDAELLDRDPGSALIPRDRLVPRQGRRPEPESGERGGPLRA